MSAWHCFNSCWSWHFFVLEVALVCILSFPCQNSFLLDSIGIRISKKKLYLHCWGCIVFLLEKASIIVTLVYWPLGNLGYKWLLPFWYALIFFFFFFLHIKSSGVYGMICHREDFATYLLGILVSNLLLYTFFYILMKVWHLVGFC